MIELGPWAQTIGTLLAVLVAVVPIVAGLILRTRRQVRSEETEDRDEAETRLRAEALDYQRQLGSAIAERIELERRWERERAELAKELTACQTQVQHLRAEVARVTAESELVWQRASGVGTDVLERLTEAVAGWGLEAQRRHEEHLGRHRDFEDRVFELLRDRRPGGRRHGDPAGEE